MDPTAFLPQQVLFLILTVCSHIGTSLFFAKHRFSKPVTAIVWLLYGVIFLLLPPKTRVLNFFISFCVHFILFFLTTTGRPSERGFLFLSYACVYTCTSSIYSILSYYTQSMTLKIVLAFVTMAVMQVVLYAVFLPAFKGVTPHIDREWSKFYAVVIAFFALIVCQSVFAMKQPMGNEGSIAFLLTVLAFGITYISVFNSMKNLAELSHEKQRQIHTELLQAQVETQATEATLMRQYRHDMRHHYQMLLTLVQDGETDKVIGYLEQQAERIERMGSERFCENDTINNILKVYHQKATQQKIDTRFSAGVKSSTAIPAPELVIILANILENALHGAVESGSAAPFITASVKHKVDRLVIHCENSCLPTLCFDEMPEQMRGIGTRSILTTADRFGGVCRFFAKDGIFKCIVVLGDE